MKSKSKKTKNDKNSSKKIILFASLIIVFIVVIIILLLIFTKNKTVDIGYIGKLDRTKIVSIDDEKAKTLSNELIITFNENVAESERKSLIEQYNGKIIGEIYSLGQYQVTFETNNLDELSKIKDNIDKSELTTNVSLNYVYENEVAYNKVGSNNQEIHLNKDYHLKDLKINEAYDKVSSKRINVGIIDSLVDYLHEDLSLKKHNMFVLASEDFPTIDHIIRYYDDYFHDKDYDNIKINHEIGGVCNFLREKTHGTHVAGIISAKRNNKGIDGINDQVNLYYASPWYYMKDDNADGRITQMGTMFSYVYALTKLIQNDVRVINMSIAHNIVDADGKVMEITDDNKVYLNYLNYFNNSFAELSKLNKDFLIVKAGGNDNKGYYTDVLSKVFDNSPYLKDRTIIVGGLRKPFTLSSEGTIFDTFNFKYKKGWYSNYGDAIDIFAPGAIYSTINGNDYYWAEGTSQATPVVSGIASLVYAANNNLTAKEVKNILISSATEYLEYEKETYPIVNAYEAVLKAYDTSGSFENKKSDYGIISGTIDETKHKLDDNTNVAVVFKNKETQDEEYETIEAYNYSSVLKKGTYDVYVKIDDKIYGGRLDVKIGDDPVTFNIKLLKDPVSLEELKTEEEEKLAEGIKVGKYTLKYGHYENMNTISAAALDITINPDNTCTYQTDNQKLYGTDACTYEIKEYSGTEFDGSYVSGYHIIFHISGQSDKYFNVNNNNTFIDQSAQLKYVD